MAYLAVVLLMGFNPIGVHYTVLELPPFWGAMLRFAPASLIMFLLVFILRLPLPRGKTLRGAMIFGALNFGLSYALLYYGLKSVQPGMATVLLSLVPLFTLLFAILHRQERFRWRALAGSLLALTGIVVVFQEQLRFHVPLFSMLAVILGAVCLAEASVIVKSYPKSHPVTTNAVGMAVGAIIQFSASLIWQEKWSLPVRPVTWLALTFLILFGSCLAFILVLFVLKHWPASTVSYQFVLMPFVSVTASALLDKEILNPILLVGAVLVLSGVFFGVIYTPRKPLPVEETPCATCE